MMIFSWLKRRRRERILAQPFPDEWLAYVQENVAQYRLLAPTEQEKLRRRVQVFVAEKKWVGCGGLELNDEMKVTIAAQACLLVLGIQYEYHYDQILSLIRASREGRATLLNQYGASSRAEFFAVATECFFERPLALETASRAVCNLAGFLSARPGPLALALGATEHGRT